MVPRKVILRFLCRKEKHMALSKAARKRLEVAMARRAEAQEVADAIDAGGNAQAAAIAALGAQSAVGTTDGSGGAGDAALATDVNSRVQAIQQKLDAVIAALKAAGLMAS
jgi:hypothetical protein